MALILFVAADWAVVTLAALIVAGVSDAADAVGPGFFKFRPK